MMFNEGSKYLLDKGKSQVTNSLIDRYLIDYDFRKPIIINGKDGLFYKMIEHARNRQRISNIVDYKSEPDIDNDYTHDYKFYYLKDTLFDFDPKKVLNEYRYYESEFKLLNNIKAGISELLKNEPNNKGLQSLTNKLPKKEKPDFNNYWVSFSKSIISIAEFLSRFNKIEEFKKFIKEFDDDDYSRIYLALLLDNEIYGYGFALACDFLKENCNQEYVKPDTHIIKLFTDPRIVNELDINISQQTLKKAKRIEASKTKRNVDNKKENYNTKEQIEIFRAVIDYSKSINKLPYEVDKLFWLIGSGYFYRLPDFPKTEFKIGTNIEDFIATYIEKLNSKYGFT
ncbi:hypothetical protein [Methanosarcina sp.]|uniref:hypothetical protein n=1 Tax=Methanosarcina sp. TaxID=2213 RepID=UPI003BB81508